MKALGKTYFQHHPKTGSRKIGVVLGLKDIPIVAWQSLGTGKTDSVHKLRSSYFTGKTVDELQQELDFWAYKKGLMVI